MAKQKDLLNPNLQVDPQTGLLGTDPKTGFKIIGTIQPQGFQSLSSTPTEGFDKEKYAKYFDDQPIVSGEFTNLDEERAQRQSAGEQIRNGLGKMGVLALGTLADNTVGTLVGLGNLAQGESFIDNPFSRWIQEIEAKSEEWMPNYYTQEGQESFKGWLPGTEGSANFWGDKVLKNFGFTIGTVASGALSGGALASIPKIGIKALAKNFAKGLAKAEGTTVKKALEMIKNGTIDATKLSDDLVKSAAKLKTANLATQFGGATLGSIGESRIEALHASDEFVRTETAKATELFRSGSISNNQYEQRLSEIDKQKEAVQNMVFGGNMAILTASNMLQFRDAFTGGFKLNNTLDKKLGNLIKKEGDAYVLNAPTTKLGKAGAFAGKLGKGLTNAGIEGNEEQMQQVINTTSKTFYGRQLDPNAGSTTDNFVNSFFDGMKEGYGTSEGWEQFFIGAFTGVMGSPTFSTQKGNRWAGGVAGELREEFAKKAEAAKLVPMLNKGLADLKDNYLGLKRHISYENDKNVALKNEDILGFKNAEHAQFVNTVLTFAKAGKTDDLLNQIDGMKSADPQEIRDMFKTVNPDGTTIDPFADKLTQDDLKRKINERSNSLRKNAERILELKDAIDTKFSGQTDKVKDELLYYASTIDNSTERINDITASLGKKGVYLDQEALYAEENPVPFVKKVMAEAKVNPLDEEQILRDAKDLKPLIKQRQEFVDKYAEAAGIEGLAKLEKKLTKVEEKINKDAQTETLKDKIGQIITDEQGNSFIVKQDSKGNIYKTPVDKDGNATGETTDATVDEVTGATKALSVDALVKKLLAQETTDDPDEIAFYEANKDEVDRLLMEAKSPEKSELEKKIDALEQERKGHIFATAQSDQITQEQKDEMIKKINKEYDDKIEALKEPPTTSDQNPNPNLSDSKFNKFKRKIDNLFRRPAGNQSHPKEVFKSEMRKPGEPYTMLNNDIHQRRYFQFITKNKVRGKKLQFFTMKQFYGDDLETFYSEMEKRGVKRDLFRTSIICAVTDKEGKFLDVNGNVLTDQSLSKVRREGVYSFLPEANPMRSNGSRKYYIPSKSKTPTKEETEFADKIAKEETEKYRGYRQTILDSLEEGKTVTVDIIGKDGGVPNYIDSNDTITPLGLIPGATLKIARDKSFTSNQLHTVNDLNAGEAVLLDENENIIHIEKSHLSPTDSSLVADLILAFFRNNFFRVEASNDTENVWFSKFKDSSGKEINVSPLDILKAYIPFLQQKKGGPNEFFFAQTSKGTRSTLKLNMNGEIITVLNPDGTIDPTAKDKIVNHLQTVSRYNVNNKILESKVPFYEVKSVNIEKGTIEFETKDEKGYTEFLGSSIDGQPRLFTNVAVNSTVEVKSFDPLAPGSKPFTATEQRTPRLNNQLQFDYTALQTTTEVDELEDFRIAGESKEKENLPEKIAWFKERFPQIDVKIIEGLIKGKAWGKVHKAVMYLSTEAEVGTTYHEAWHIVTSVFLTEEERQVLYKEYRKVTGKTELSDKQVEEALADEYMNHKLGVPSKFAAKGTIVDRIFRKLNQFINWMRGLPTDDVRAIFDKIDKGYYKNAPMVSISRQEFLRPRTVNGDYAFTSAAVKAMNVFFFRHFFGKDASKEAFDSIFSKTPNPEQLEAAYVTVKLWINKHINAKSTSEEAKKNFQAILDNFDELRKIHEEQLITYNLEVIRDDEVEEPEVQRDKVKQWNDNSIKASVKSTASNRMQLILGTLSKTNEKGTVYNEYGFPELEDFGVVFGTVVNRLAGSLNVDQMYHKLVTLSLTMPVIKKLIERLKITADPTGNVITTKDLSNQEMSNLSDFINTFSKNFYNYLVTSVGGKGDVKIIDVITNGLRDKIRDTWSSNVDIVHGSKEYHNHYTEHKGILVYVSSKFKETPSVTTWESAKNFYKILGITFKNESQLSGDNISDLITIAQTIRKRIINTKNMPIIFEQNADSGVAGYVNQIIDIEQSTRLNDFENSHFNIGGENVYNAGLNSYVTTVINTINNAENLEELYKELPWLDPQKDFYVRNSEILKILFEGKRTKLVFGVVEGSREEHHGDAEEFNKLSFTDKLANKINYILDGKYFMLRPGDNKQERWFSFGRGFLSNTEVVNQQKHLGVLIDYLKDELSRTMHILQNGSEIAFKAANAKEGIILSIISDPKFSTPLLIENLEKLYADNGNAEEFVNNNKELIQNALKKFISNDVTELEKLLVSFKVIGTLNKETQMHENYGLKRNQNFTTSISHETLVGTLTEAVVNNMISSVEQTKLFYGDTISYKSIIDQFKRHESANSTRKHLVVDNIMNSWLDLNYERTDGKTFENSNYEGHPTIITATLDDIISEAHGIEDIKKRLKTKFKAYTKQNEADAQGLISMDEYREIMLRSSAWNDDLEALWQHEVNGAEKPKSNVKFVPLKLMEFGPLAEDGYTQTLYKLSVYPLVPSMVAGKNLETVATTMKEGKIGILTFSSGNKFGYKTVDGQKKAQDAYNEDGTVNTTLKTQKTYYKNWGIQLDIAPKSKMSVGLGTQMMKQIFSNLFDKGSIARKHLEKVVTELRDVNAERIAIGVRQLKEELGLKQVGNNYEIDSAEKLIKTLQKEAQKRNMPDNVIEQIANIKNDSGIDTLIAREKIEQYLMALADAMTTSQKVFGNNAVQMSSAFFEELGFKRTKKDGVFTSGDLKFYTVTEDGKKVTRMQVYLPDYWKGRVKVGDKLTNIIGFRIPTQGMNSIEAIEVAGFLPESCGEMIVLPSEIVAKSGGDFDIDKMTIYLPNFYWHPVTGKPAYIEHLTSEEAMKEQWQNATAPMETKLLDAIFGTSEAEKQMTFDEFKKKALENRMYELQARLILDIENYDNLITPNTTDSLKATAAQITWIREGKPNLKGQSVVKWYEGFIDNAKHYSVTQIKFQLDLAERFQGGVRATGPTALMSTFLLACQEFNIHINESETTFRLAHSTDKPNMFDSVIALGSQFNVKGESISDLISQWINLSVDAAKEPHMSMMGVGMHNLPIVLYLTAAGVDRDTIAAFMNQPIVLKYYKQREIDESQISEENFPYADRNKDVRIANLKSLFSRKGEIKTAEGGENFELEELQGMVLDSGKKKVLTDAERSKQLAILEQLLAFEEMAQEMSLAVRSIGFDTAAGGKNIIQLLLKQRIIQRILDKNIIKNFDKALSVNRDGTPDSEATSFMAPYYKAVYELNSMLVPFTKFLSHPVLNFHLNRFLDEQIEAHKGNSEKIIKNATAFRQDLFTWLFMTQPITIDGQTFEIRKELEGLFFDKKTNIARQLLAVRKKMPNNALLKQFVGIFPHTNYVFGTVDYLTDGETWKEKEPGVRVPYNIKFVGSKDEAIDVNTLVAAWDELMADPFGMNLLKACIVQTGFQNSPMSFFSLIPSELSNKIMDQLIQKVDSIGALDIADAPLMSEYVAQFDQNNPFTLPKTREDNSPGNVRKKRYMKVNDKPTKDKSKLPVIFNPSTKKEVLKKLIALMDYKGSHVLKKYFRSPEDGVVTKDVDELIKPVETQTGQLELNLETTQPLVFQESQTTGYRDRTIKNASADATIALAVDFDSAGERLTKSSVINQNKKYIPVNANSLEVTQERIDKIVDKLNSVNVKTLNIAGNGIYTMRGKYTQEQVDNFTYDLLKAVLNSPNLVTKITSIRTGGQTGFDEAGAKAGVKLGIPTLILAPKGWVFRNINGQDIANEQQFKARFEVKDEVKPPTLLREHTSENITILKPDEVFVFGSNKGSSNGGPPTHGRGAALLARQKFGAIQGQSEGLQGQSYAVVTKKFWDKEKSSTLSEIQEGLSKMLEFASKNQNKKFLVTKLGSSLAGYSVGEIKQLFENLKHRLTDNVVLPKEYEVRQELKPRTTEQDDENTSNVPFCLK